MSTPKYNDSVKSEIIEFSKTHSVKETMVKYNIARQMLLLWIDPIFHKKQLERNARYYQRKIQKLTTTTKYCACGCGQLVKNINCQFLQGHSNSSLEVKNKKEQVFLDKYGVNNPSQLQEIKDKKKATLQANLGVDVPAKSPVVMQKMKQTCIERYGVENIFCSEQFKKDNHEKWQNNKENIIKKIQMGNWSTFYDELINTDRLKSKFTVLFTKEEYVGVGDKDKKYPFKCNKCGTICESNLDDGSLPRCYICYPLITSGGQSIIENELVYYVRQLETDIKVQNRSTIFPLELDIVIPQKNIAIELDGLYWHSDVNGGKDKNYHLNKTLLCGQENIRLIHIFEDEWRKKKKIVKGRLKHILGKDDYRIYGRKCEIKNINDNLKSKFLNKYHIQFAS